MPGPGDEHPQALERAPAGAAGAESESEKRRQAHHASYRIQPSPHPTTRVGSPCIRPPTTSTAYTEPFPGAT